MQPFPIAKPTYRKTSMKIFSLILASLVLGFNVKAQNQFETIDDNGKIFKGIISRELIEKEPSFTWYAEGKKGYVPNAAAVTGLKKSADSVQLIVFMGTWCEDSHFVIPKFFSVTDAAGFKAQNISLIGVDRNKKTLGNLAEALNVKNVPTIIVMKKGKEVGRVIEYGTSGSFEKDLSELLK